MNFILFTFLNLNLIYASFTEEFHANWLEKYRQVSGNQNPPKMYKDWIAAANRLNVDIAPEKFKPIFEHLAHFKKTGISVQNVKDYLNKIKQLYPERVDIVGLDTNALILNTHIKGDEYSFNFRLLSDVLDPNIDCFGIVQKFDEGMVIPADEDDSKPYVDMADVFKRSSHMRKEMGEYADKVIVLQAPSSFHVIPFYAPVFGVYRLKGAKDILLANDLTGIGRYESSLHMALNSPKWEEKTFTAMFRGTATGIGYIKAVTEGIPLTNSPRFKLHQMSDLQKAGKLNCRVPLDFGIADLRLGKCPANVINAVSASFKDATRLTFDAQFRYKYLVIVDGNGAADRISLYMASGSLIFLSTVAEDWTINQIIPGEHYIKVKPDLSDLIEKLEWAADNDAEAKRIAQNGKEFALKYLRKPNRQIYNALLFMEYQALFDTGNSTKSN